MPRYYCDYCDTYLTHDSPSVRKQHNAGYKHKANVRNYYQQYEAQLNQSLIDQKVKEHLGAFRPPVAPYGPLRPGLPILPTPIPGQMPAGAPLVPGVRPPVLPRPMPPGYASGPPMPQMVPPPGAPMPGQMNGLQRPMTAPGSAGNPTSGAPPMFAPPPMSAPPMSTLPMSAPPMSALPMSAPPMSALPMSARPMSAPISSNSDGGSNVNAQAPEGNQ